MPIAGVLGKDGWDAAEQIVTMLDVQCHRQPDAIALITKDALHKAKSIEDLKFLNLKGDKALGQASFAFGEGAETSYYDSENGLSLIYEGELYNYDELVRRVVQRCHLNTTNSSEVILYLLEVYYQGDLKSAVGKVMRDMDGAYVLVASDGANMVVARDPVGKRPAYFAEDDHRVCFASEKKALWKAGLRNVKTLRAGKLAVFGAGEVEVEKAFSLEDISYTPEIKSLSQALSGYKEALYEAVEKRLTDLNQAGALISVGVDSCLIAMVVQEIGEEKGIEVVYYSAGLTGSPDLEYAKSFAQNLNLPLKVSQFDIDSVESLIPRVIQAVEERDFVQVETGIGVFAAMERARQDGIKVIFSGQGPDELWGGYSWYPQVVKEEGYDGFLRREWEDLERVDIETLEREVKLAMFQGMEERFPYLDIEVVKLAISVAPELKILSPEDGLGKRPHRELAKQLGVPPQNAERLKDAAQHGSGIHSVLDKIAQRNGFTPDLIEDIGYSLEEITEEKLGSSTRYGYQYSDKSLWLIPPHVQLYFDIIAYEAGLLNEAEREKISYFVKLMGR